MIGIHDHVSRGFRRFVLGSRGNILIYVLMTMVIFAVVGVTMVSLMSTSIQQLGHRERNPPGGIPGRVRPAVRDERAAAERILADQY